MNYEVTGYLSVLVMHIMMGENIHHLQECIPVGCVPHARLPYAVVCFPRGVYLVRGSVPGLEGCTWSGGVPGLGRYLVQAGTWSGGGCTWSGGRGCTWSQGGAWSRGDLFWGVPGLGGTWSGVPGPGGCTWSGTPPDQTRYTPWDQTRYPPGGQTRSPPWTE